MSIFKVVLDNIHKKNVLEICKYVIIGISGVLLDATIYSLLLFISFPIAFAKSISIITASLFGYYLNASWTFQGIINRSTLIRYCTLYGISIAINIAINSFIISVLGRNILFFIFAFLVATFISMCINFIGLKFWVFKK